MFLSVLYEEPSIRSELRVVEVDVLGVADPDSRAWRDSFAKEGAEGRLSLVPDTAKCKTNCQNAAWMLRILISGKGVLKNGVSRKGHKECPVCKGVPGPD